MHRPAVLCAGKNTSGVMILVLGTISGRTLSAKQLFRREQPAFVGAAKSQSVTSETWKHQFGVEERQVGTWRSSSSITPLWLRKGHAVVQHEIKWNH